MANYYNKDLYKILNVSFDASLEEIKASYRKLVRTCHPDVAGENADVKKFKDIQEAYEILSNETKRRKYDALHGFFQEKIKKNYQQQQKKEKDYNEYIKKAKQKSEESESFSKSINEALDNLFNSPKGSSGQNDYRMPKSGEDINIDLTISEKEAINGATRKVNILHTQPCTNCGGRKFINGSQCSVCNGTGQLSQQKKISVKIPKGVTQGSKVRIKNEGNKGINGGKDGDLYLIINIEQNPNYKTDGLDIIYDLPITPFEAVLGADVAIEVLENRLIVKIPPMTSSGQKLRLANMGLENKQQTKKGDVIINVSIKLPKKLSENEKELYEELKSLSSCDIRSELKNGK